MSKRPQKTPQTLEEMAEAADAAAAAIAAWDPDADDPTYSPTRRARAQAIRDALRPAHDVRSDDPPDPEC